MRKIWLALAIIFSCSPVAAKTWFLPDYQYGIESFEKCASRGLRNNPQSGMNCTAITVDGITCYKCKGCEEYGLLDSISNGMSCTPDTNTIPGVTCYKCTACSDDYKYTTSNCPSSTYVLSEKCDNKYKKCTCNPAIYEAQCPDGYIRDHNNCCTDKNTGEKICKCIKPTCETNTRVVDCQASGSGCTPSTINGCEQYCADECPDKCAYLLKTGQARNDCKYGCATGKSVANCPGLCYECKDKCTYLVETGQAISNCPYGCAAGKEVSGCPGLCYECKDKCTYLVETGQAISNCPYGCAAGKEVSGCPGLCAECKPEPLPETPRIRCYEHVNPNKYVLTHQCAINGKGDGYICNKVGENAGVNLPANCTIDEFANACRIVGDDSGLEDEAYFQGVNIGCPHGCQENDEINIMKAGCTLCNYCTDCSYMNNGKKATDEYSNCVPDSDPIKLIKEYCPANTSDKCGDATYPFRKGAWYIPSIGEMLDLFGMNISKMTSDGSILDNRYFNDVHPLDEIDRLEYMTAESLYKIEAELITLHERYNQYIDGGVTPLVYEHDDKIPGWTIYGSITEDYMHIGSSDYKTYTMTGGSQFLTSTEEISFYIRRPFEADANLPGDLPEILKRKAIGAVVGSVGGSVGGSGRIRPMISLTGSTDNNTMLPGVGNTVFYKNDNSEDRVSFIPLYKNAGFDGSTYDELKAEFGDPVGVVSSAIINETDMTYDVRIIALKNIFFSNAPGALISWPEDLYSSCPNVYPVREDDTRELSRCYIALKGGNWLNIIPNE